MITQQIATYRHTAQLKDGSHVELRAMVAADYPALIALFATASDEDTRYVRHNIKDAAVVRGWCDGLDYARVCPLVAWFDGAAVGLASLHYGRGPERHLARVRMFVARPFRQRGLGTAMLKALIDLAREHGTHTLLAEVVASQPRVIRACMQLGFELSFTLPDSFMLPDGTTRAVTLLRLCLQPPCDDEL